MLMDIQLFRLICKHIQTDIYIDTCLRVGLRYILFCSVFFIIINSDMYWPFITVSAHRDNSLLKWFAFIPKNGWNQLFNALSIDGHICNINTCMTISMAR